MSSVPLFLLSRRSFVTTRQLGATTTLTDKGAVDEAAVAATNTSNSDRMNSTVARNGAGTGTALPGDNMPSRPAEDPGE